MYSLVNYRRAKKGPRLVADEVLSRARVMLLYALSETRLLLICCVVPQLGNRKEPLILIVG